MKYTCAVEINLSRDEMLAKLDNADNMYKWQQGLIAHEFTHGEPGEVGSKMKLQYKMGKREMEMTETILGKNWPETWDMSYDAKGVHNICNNRFLDLGPNKSKWEMDSEFQLKGFMKVMGWLMPGMFKKQTNKMLKAFKDFAENGTSVN